METSTATATIRINGNHQPLHAIVNSAPQQPQHPQQVIRVSPINNSTTIAPNLTTVTQLPPHATIITTANSILSNSTDQQNDVQHYNLDNHHSNSNHSQSSLSGGGLIVDVETVQDPNKKSTSRNGYVSRWCSHTALSHSLYHIHYWFISLAPYFLFFFLPHFYHFHEG